MLRNADNLRSASLIVLAAAVAYFGYALIRTADKLVMAVQQAREISESVQPLIELAPRFLEESEKLRGTATAVLEEVAATRALVPPILNEAAEIRAVMPTVWAQLELIRTESAAVRREVAEVRGQLPAILSEMEAYRALIPTILDESERIRLLVPPTLDRIDAIVVKADKIAQTAGENVFTGMISGIFKAPLSLMGKVTGLLLPSGVQVSDADRRGLERDIQAFLSSAKVGDVGEYTSDQSALHWEYELLSDSENDGELCRTLGVNSYQNREQLQQTDIVICQDRDGHWLVQDSGKAR